MNKPSKPKEGKITILVVEDSPTQIMNLEYLLSEQGYQLYTATNGKQALAIMMKKMPDIVISDIVMPEMNGYQLCQQIKSDERTRHIPVILLTCLSNPEDVFEGLACGADNFITKPYSEDYLLSQVEHILVNRHLYQTERLRIGTEILFAGKRRFITVDQQQMLTLLISTYEAATIRNRELLQMHEELKAMNEQLEEMVEERTKDLKSNEEKYLDLYNNAPSMFYSVEAGTGLVVDCNDTLLHRTGFFREEVIGTHISNLYHPDFHLQVKNNLELFRQAGEVTNIEMCLQTKLGGKIPVLLNATAVCDHDGKFIYSRTVLQDISELKKIEEELRLSEEQYRAIEETAVDAIITVDEVGLVVRWNPAAQQLFGYKEKDILAQPVTIIIPGDFIKRHLAGFKSPEGKNKTLTITRTLELEGKRKNGSLFPLELSMATWSTSEGQYLTGIIRDITERKLVEKELLIAKNKAEESDCLKSAFLANMSHEIRTPMNGILGFTQLLQDPDLTPEARDKFLGIINSSSLQLLKIITAIVDISKIEAGYEEIVPIDFNLNKLLQEVITLYTPIALKRNLKLVLVNRLTERQAMISSDPVKLKQALENLIDNALKFTDNGWITVEVEMHQEILSFSVIDTGIGIEPELKPKIFDRFRQGVLTSARKYGGTGLGLALAKSYVEMLGGSIRVDSAPGEGSTFTLYIPYIPSDTGLLPEEPTRDVSEVLAGKWKGLSILIAEDEEGNAFYLSTILKPTGIEIITASNGKETVEACKIHPDISLILMDVKMPVLDGLAATRIIRTFRPDLPIIATTAFALSSDRERCLSAGCNDYLPKPIRKENLIHIINNYLS